METRLLQILVCPSCKGPLHHDREHDELICHAEHLAYPIADGVPVLLARQARSLQAGSDTPA
ncbi:Trm112 family protein [Castellaniella sp.]|uniref:Trm112 family protein n=1 Tax=Castellaniella sp. TaxID=1955812 RepID=UPI003568A13C